MRYLRKKSLQNTLATLIVAITTVTATPIRANTPVLDSSSLAQLVETLGINSKQLTELAKIFDSVNKVQEAIGKVGTGNIGGILKLLGSNFGLGGLGDLGKIGGALKGLTATIGNIQNFANHAKNNDFQGAFTQLSKAFENAGNGISSTQQAITESLYQSSQGATQASIDAKSALRSINLRQAATSGMAVALQGKKQTETLSEDIQKLASEAKSSKDLRGDIAVNNAIMLKVLEQLQQLTAQQSAQLHINSSSTIAGDSFYNK